MTNPLPVDYLLDEYKDITSEEVARLYAEIVDRWTWDTGSEEDAKLMRKLGQEHRWRASSSKMFPEPKTIEEAFSREITNEIDRTILRDLINIADDIES